MEAIFSYPEVQVEIFQIQVPDYKNFYVNLTSSGSFGNCTFINLIEWLFVKQVTELLSLFTVITDCALVLLFAVL